MCHVQQALAGEESGHVGHMWLPGDPSPHLFLRLITDGWNKEFCGL